MAAAPSGQASPSKRSTSGRVLVIFPGALGDLICLGPALRALGRRHRGLSLELMAREELARFAVGRMGVARGHSIDRREVSGLFAESAEPANFREPASRDSGAQEVSTEIGTETQEFFAAFDRIYSFFASRHRRFRDSLTIASSGAASFHPFRPGGPGHVAAAYLRSLGEHSSVVESRIELLADDIEAAARRLERHGLVPGEFVLLLPGSGSPAKNWPPEKFAQLGEALAARAGGAVVLGPAESRLEAIFAARGL
ncbi:MAG: hypothetical protein WA005_03780, partial [Candidatus Binataceae bacterium]